MYHDTCCLAFYSSSHMLFSNKWWLLTSFTLFRKPSQNIIQQNTFTSLKFHSIYPIETHRDYRKSFASENDKYFSCFGVMKTDDAANVFSIYRLQITLNLLKKFKGANWFKIFVFSLLNGRKTIFLVVLRGLNCRHENSK